MKNKILAALIAILAFGQGAMAASTFTVSNPTGSTFRITRTGNTAVSETIDWRVVSLSAIAGVHFTGVGGQYSGTVTFDANDTYRDVTISESTPGDNAYKYQNGTSRSYRFEVLDRNGDILTSCDRSRDYGTSVPSSGAFDIKDVTIYSSEYTADDDGYDKNGYKSVSSSGYFTSSNAPKAYLQQISAQLRMTLSFQAKENDDAYEYLQLLFDNTSTCDNRSDCSNGDPGNISLSTYMAGFEMNTGSKDDTYRDYTFPVTSVGNNAGAENPWGYGTKWPLSKQKFNSSRASDGRIIVPMNFSSIVLRLNASGSSGSDEWAVKNVKAHIQACDPTAPTVLNNYKVSGGRHQKGNVIYVSVAFSEIVTVSGTPTLATSWGTLSYCAGSGSNVLTFRGEISSDATGTFSVTGHSGTIKDLAGNALSGTVSHDFGTALDADYAWTAADFNSLGTNTYEIATKTDLQHLAYFVNVNHNECSGITFRQTQDIVCDETYTPIGYYINSSNQARFRGTYDGQGHTVSNITVTRTGYTSADNYIGLFGRTGTEGTVQNVVLANSTLTGYDSVGGIMGYNNGTVRNCRVESTVTIKAGNTGAFNHGGIVGHNDGYVTGCVSAAIIQDNGNSVHKYCGGIAGRDYYSTTRDCLYTGATVEAAEYKGGISGYNEDSRATYANNYYTSVSIGGVNGSDQNGARRARTITLGEGVALVGGEVTYDVSGLTAIGTSALRTSDGTIYSGEGQTLTLSYTGAIPDGYTLSGYSVNGTPIDGNSFTMPAGDVTVTANVVPVITYIDADGNEQSVVGPTPIVSNEFQQYYGAEGQTNWYYVSGPVSSRQIKFSDAASNIILCDGATLSINAGSLSGIINENGSVNIFSQSRGSGSITVSGTSYSSDKGIYAKSNIDINGGTFTSSVTNYGLYSKEGDVTIRGGIVNISARYDGIYGKENVNIIGGIVNASSTSSNSSYGGINSSGNITIGVSSASDRITASSYKYTTLKVADGQILTDGTDTYTGTLNADQIAAIAGKTLRMPFDPAEATVNLTAHSGTLAGQTHYWATFYHPNWNYTLPAGAKAYIVKEDKNLYRVGDGTIIPAGVAVVIMAESASLTLTATNANAPAVVGNILQGSDSTVPVAGLSGTPYVLGKVGDVLGFYQYTGTSIPAGKAYYLVVP